MQRGPWDSRPEGNLLGTREVPDEHPGGHQADLLDQSTESGDAGRGDYALNPCAGGNSTGKGESPPCVCVYIECISLP